MGKPVGASTQFASTSPPWSLTSLDTNFTNLVSAFNDYSTYSNFLTDTSGVANAITVNTQNGTAFAYTTGIQVQVQVAVTTTSTSVTLNVNSLGAKTVKNSDGSNPAIGQLVAGGIYVFQYDGTNFQVLGSAAGFTGFANPATSIGLAMVPGSATTAMRSDAAPALSQAIAPSWTALHTFTAGLKGTLSGPGPNAALIASGAATIGLGIQNTGGGADSKNWDFVSDNNTQMAWRAVNDAVNSSRDVIRATRSGLTVTGVLFGNATDNNAFSFLGTGTSTFTGPAAFTFNNSNPTATVYINANPPTLDYNDSGQSANNRRWRIGPSSGSFVIQSLDDGVTAGKMAFQANRSGNVVTSVVFGNTTDKPPIQGIGPVAGAAVDMTPDTGSFTITYTGMTATVTGTAVWSRVGNLVMLVLPAGTGTSNSTSFTATGLPSAIQPARTQDMAMAPDALLDNNASQSNSTVRVSASSGTIDFAFNANTPPGVFTNLNSKGIFRANTIYYLLN